MPVHKPNDAVFVDHDGTLVGIVYEGVEQKAIGSGDPFGGGLFPVVFHILHP